MTTSPDTAVLFGAIAATLLSAITVILAFVRPAVRWAVTTLGGRFSPSFADHLCAGIWFSAVGAAIIAGVALLRLVTGVLVSSVASLGWCLVGAGYFLHFTAWRASFRGDTVSLFQWRWAFILVTLGTGAAVTFFLLPG